MLTIDFDEKFISADNHVLETYRTCEEKYRLMIRDQWTPDSSAPALAFGIAMHAARAAYKKAFLQQDTLVKYKLTHEQSPIIDYAINIGLLTWSKEMPDDMKTEVKVNDKRSCLNFERLARGYFAKYGNPDEFTPLHVEVPGNRFLGTTPKGWRMDYVYTIDEVVQHQGKIYPLEFKTGSGFYPPDSFFFEKFHNMASVTGYLWAVEQEFGVRCEGAMIHAMWVHAEPKTTSKSKYTLPDYFKMDYTYRDDAQIEEWKENTLRTADDIVQSIAEDRWKRNDGVACSMYNGCSMKKICQSTPAIRQRLLEIDYRKRPWNPWARMEE